MIRSAGERVYRVLRFVSERHGGLISALAAALLVMFLLAFNLGEPGLWDPWEMDRAHLARNMAEETVAVVVEARDRDEGAVAAAIREMQPTRYRVLTPTAGPDVADRSVPLQLRRLRDLLIEQSAQLMAIDLEGLTGDGSAPARLGEVVKSVREARTIRPAIEVALFAPRDEEASEVAREVLEGLLRLEREDTPGEADSDDHPGEPASLAVGREFPEADFHVFDGPQDEAFGLLLAQVAGRERCRAEVRVGDTTHAIPPLDFQLMAVSYRLFGFTETGARLPSLLWGLFGLLALAAVARQLFGPRVAMLSVLVLASTPMFIAQVRHISGNISFGATLTAGIGAYLVLVRHGWRLRWGILLAVACLLAFLSNGLTALMILWLVMAAYAAVTPERRLVVWLPPLLLAVFFAAAVVLVLGAETASFFSSFKFMDRPFQGGPDHAIRNFDYFVRQIGFGAFPWSALVPFAFGRLLYRRARSIAPTSPRGRESSNLGVVLWFALPFGVLALMLKDFSHAVYPGVPVVALAVALLLDELLDGSRARGFLAFCTFLLLVIIAKQLGETPEPLTSALTYDPHFADEKNVFPEMVELSRGLRYMMVLAGGLLLVYGLRLGSKARRLAGYLRQPEPFWATLYTLAGLAVVALFTLLLLRIDSTLSRPEARALQPAERLVALRTMGGVWAFFTYIWLALSFMLYLFTYSAWGRALAARRRLFRHFARMAERVPRRLFLAVVTGVALLALVRLFVVLVGAGSSLLAQLSPGSEQGFLRELLFGSRLVVVPLGLMVAVVLNRLWREPWRRYAVVFRGLELFERPRPVVAAFVLAAVVFAAGVSRTVFAELALHVSQKHVIETYLEAEERAALGNNIFKHGRFASAGQSETNFYTNQIPEIAEQRAVVAALRKREDTVLTPARRGARQESDSVLLPGFDPRNDGDGDGRRDWPAYGGIATEAGPGFLEDHDADWEDNQWKGFRLHLAERNRELAVIDNTSTRLRVAGTPRLGRTPAMRRYAIDSPEGRVPHATAMDRSERVYFLLPKLAFSGINHAFRQAADGAPIALLDSRSSRLVLAVSHLKPGETDQNWITEALITEEEMAEREWFPETPGSELRRVRANWNDQIEILGYVMERETVARRQRYRIKMFFRTLAPLTTSFKIFMHVDRAGGAHRIHSDHWPLNLERGPGDEPERTCRGCFETRHWIPGDIYVNRYEREVPLGTPAGAQDIWLGFYNPSDDNRLPIKDYDEETVTHDGQNRIRIGTFEVR